MLTTFARRVAVAIALVGAAGCTVHQADTATPSGPSTLAHIVTMTAIPDRITQDGSSQSSVVATALGPDGRPQAGVILRMDMIVSGVLVDYGTLSGRSIVTGPDGTARAVYTAPPAPPPPASSTVTTVSIRAIPIGSDAAADNVSSVDIRLMPAGVILPPAGTPIANFTATPIPVTAGTPTRFDASSSQPGTGATAIVSYNWDFGDGTVATGKQVTHTFSINSTTTTSFNVTLTVTNDRGLSASASQFIPVSATPTAGQPTAKFTISPTSPSTNQPVFFNASTSTAATGHSLTSFAWDFGDGGTGSGVTVTHAYAVSGIYTATLIVTDDIGQKQATTLQVTVTGGSGASAPTANFTFSPSAPGVNETVFFNASASTAGPGHTIASYRWAFGDGGTGSGVTVSHAYVASGNYSVQLTVTDESGQSTTSAGTSVPVGTQLSPTANFTFSPQFPAVGQQVIFDASGTLSSQGQTIVDVAWNYGDGTAVVHCGTLFGNDPSCVNTATTNRVSQHTYAFQDIFTVNLVVTDSAGRTGSTNHPITVISPNPQAVLILSKAGGNSINADGSGSTPVGNATITTYRFIWGDATPDTVGAANSVSHDYGGIAGPHTVTLVVTDNNGRSGSTSKDITTP